MKNHLSTFQPRFQWLVLGYFILISCISASAQDRFRTKGRINAYVGGGGGFTQTKSTSYNYDEFGEYSSNLELGGDYGFTKWLAGGITIFRNSINIHKVESSNQKAENVGVGLYALFYLVLRPKHIWYGYGGAGYSGLFYEQYGDDTKASSSGKYYQLGFGVRRYFGPHFGFFIQTLYCTHYYNKLSYESGFYSGTKDSNWKMNLTNLDISAGLVVAFGKK